MDLDLDIDVRRVRTGGRPSKLEAAVTRELEESDLALLEVEAGIKTPLIQRLTERHHALARLVAVGRFDDKTCAYMAGYNPQRLTLLRADPTFTELVEFYRADLQGVYENLHDGLCALSKDALEELRHRLENEPEALTTGQIMEAIKLGADRTGFGPASTSTQVNVNVDIATRLEAARKRVAARPPIEIEAETLEVQSE